MMHSFDFNMFRLEVLQDFYQIIVGTNPTEQTMEIANPAGWIRSLVHQQEQAERDLQQLHQEKNSVSGCRRCVCTLHTHRKRLDAQDVNQQGILRSDNVYQCTCCTESDPPIHMRTRQKWAAHWPSGRLISSQMASGRYVPRHLPAGREVSVHLPSERSVCLTDTECQGRCRPDEECQGICLLDVVCVLQMTSVKADVIWTMSVSAFAFWMQHATISAYRMEFGRAFSFWTHGVRASSFWTQPCQGIFLLDTAVSGHFPSGRSHVRVFSFWTHGVRAFSFWMHGVRAFFFWTQPCQDIFLLDAAVSGHFPFGHSCIRAFSFWTQPCQGIFLLDTWCQGIFLLDARCQGIFLLDAAVSGHFPSGRSRVRAFSFWTQSCQGKWYPDNACYGTMVMLAVKVQNIAANTHVVFTNTQWVPGIVTQSSSILYI